jgi:hypothetical protein
VPEKQPRRRQTTRKQATRKPRLGAAAVEASSAPLVIEVDADGAVPHAELLGTDLAGTPLEACLRTVASRWRFPSNGRAYRIDAPVKVSGSAHGR